MEHGIKLGCKLCDLLELGKSHCDAYPKHQERSDLDRSGTRESRFLAISVEVPQL